MIARGSGHRLLDELLPDIDDSFLLVHGVESPAGLDGLLPDFPVDVLEWLLVALAVLCRPEEQIEQQGFDFSGLHPVPSGVDDGIFEGFLAPVQQAHRSVCDSCRDSCFALVH